jgi:sugar lactone lactonase YvrE
LYKQAAVPIKEAAIRCAAGEGCSACLPVRLLILTLLALTLSACAPAAVQKQRYFWPIGTTEPHIEYVEFFQSDRDLRQAGANALSEAVLGRELPEFLFERPQEVASDGGKRVFVSDVAGNKVIVLDLEKHRIRELKDQEGNTKVLKFPSGLSVGDAGQLYVVDSADDVIYLFGADEVVIREIGRGHLTRPTGIAVDPKHDRLYVTDTGEHRLAVFDGQGAFLRYLGQRGTGEGEYNFPLDVEVDGDGNIFVLDALNARVQVLDPEGRFLRSFGERGTASGSFQIPKGIAVGPSGQVYVTDSMANHFVIFDREGNYLLSVGGRFDATQGDVAPGGLNQPGGIDVDESDTIWIADAYNRMIHEFQYLNEEYLSEHPILPGETYFPPGFMPEAPAGK